MKILIATDGSDYSKAAIEKCCQIIAKPEDTCLKIVSAAQIVTSVATEPLPFAANYIQEADTALREMAETFVAEARETILQNFPDSDIAVSTEVLNDSAAKAIVEAAQEFSAKKPELRRTPIKRKSASSVPNTFCATIFQ